MQFERKLDEDSEFAKKIGAELIILLDRFENLAKPKWLAKVLRALINGEIDFEMFSRLGSAIDKTNIYDINNLLSGDGGQQLLINLAPAGLTTFDVGKGGRGGRPHYHFPIPGEALRRILTFP